MQKINTIYQFQGLSPKVSHERNVWFNTLELTLVVWVNPRSVHSKFDEDGNIVAKANPLHHVKREQIWARSFCGWRVEIAAELCRAPHSGAG